MRTTRVSQLLAAFVALLGLSALLIVPPVLLVLSIGSPLPDWTNLRTGQIDDPTLIRILGCVVWVAWAQFALGTAVEAVAAARRWPMPRRVAIGQGLARALVTIIATAVATAPLIAAAPAGRAAPLTVSGPLHANAPTADPATRTPAHHRHQMPVYVVGSEPELAPSLWTIAERHLGNPLRWKEIWQINRGTTQPDGSVFNDPNVIRLGWELRLPVDATGVPSGITAEHDVTVVAGDTLSGIAEQNGFPDWRPVWTANAGRAELGGERFVDPALIKPGWTIAIPASGHPALPRKPVNGHAPGHGPQQRPSTPTTPVSPHGPTRAPSMSPSPSAAAPSAPNGGPDRPPSHAASASGSLVRYVDLFAGGGLLAACAATAITAHRRRQFARRRPGRMIATPTPELVAVEKAITVAGRPAIARVEFLDMALRDLAARLAEAGSALPDIVAAGLDANCLELILAQPVGPPLEPWEKRSDTRWALPRSAVLDDANADRLAPYPCLVSAGHAASGTEWLLDLEHARVVQLVGDADRTLDLARYMAAELALNNWSDDLTATLVGFGAELSRANPSRLCHSDDVVSQVDRLLRTNGQLADVGREHEVDVLSGRLEGVRGDVWMPHVLLVKPDVLDDSAVAVVSNLIGAIAGQSRQSPVTAVVVGSVGAPSAWQITVTGDGHLHVPGLDVDELMAHGLTEVEAGDVAAAIALARDGAPDAAVPVSDGVAPCDALIDRAGALLPEFAAARTEEVSGSGASEVGSSVLPLPSQLYVTETATTADDVEALAPAVPAQARSAVEEATSALDRDVADWHDSDCRRPKLTLLGPVRLVAHGQPPKSGWGGICTEAIAYLALHPRGASGDQFAADLWPEREYDGTSRYVQNIASAARKWLGEDPRTSDEHMPWLTKSQSETYRVDGLLVDADLFRQLRARGTARGEEGLPDLVAALELVSGRPLDRLRRAGYSWLEPGEDTLYEGMIEEVAHLVATRALADDDAEHARWASKIVLAIDSGNERALCDLATSYMIEGREPETDATVKRLRQLEDITDRTYDVMRRHGWLAGRG